jgi:hypothetical protein
LDHYDIDVKEPKKAEKKAAAAQKEAPKQVFAQGKYVNDLYDGDKSIKLENGFPKHDFSSYTIDHYESPKAGAKAGKKGKKGAKKGGVPPELAGTGAPKQAKAQAAAKGMPAELTGTGAPQAKAQTEATPEIEGGATDTISVVQVSKKQDKKE